MDFLFSLFIVEGLCAFAWMPRKCMVLDEDSPESYPSSHPYWRGVPCPRSQLTAKCMDVSNLPLDLSTVPSTIHVLCLWAGSGLKLWPNGLTKFHRLRKMYIYGCLSAILPEAFRGLTGLQVLSLDSKQHCNASLPPKVFNDLYSLEDLNLKNYELSEMAPNVLDGLSRMKSLDVKGDVNFTDLLCKMVCVPTTLESFSIEIEDAKTLKTSNCPHDERIFPALRDVRVLFWHIKRLENNAFKCLKNISFLLMPMNDVLQSQILNSGVQHIDQMDLFLTEVNIKYICEIVLVLSVTKLNLHFKSFQEYSVSSWEKCAKLVEISLVCDDLLTIDLSFMSALKNVRKCSVTLYGTNKTVVEEKSLGSLCKMHVSLQSLRHFSYTTLQNLTLSAKQFLCSTHLERLELTGRNIHLEESVFQGLHNLQHLGLSTVYPRLIMGIGDLTIERTAFKGLSGLHTLNIDGRYVIQPELFLGLVNIEFLSLRYNSIHTLQNFAFTNLTQLKHLNLDSNNMSEIKTKAFFGLQNLEILSLEGNNLMHLEASCFAHLPSLRVLHLGSLRFSSPEHSGMQLLNLTSIFGGFPRQLSHLTLSSGVRPMTLAIADDSAPDVGLSLSLSGPKIVLWGCERRFLASVTKLDASTDSFVCAPDHTVPFYHFTSVVQLSFGQWHASTVQSLTSLNRLVHLKSLALININFINQPDMSVMFRNLTKLETLSLSQCWVDSLEGDLSRDMTSLKYVYLNIKTEVSISPRFFEHLTSLRFAVIYGIQLRCTCDNVWFLSWARQQQQTEVLLRTYLDEPLRCTSTGSLQDIDRYGQAYCSLDVGFWMFISTSCFLLLFMSAVLLHQMARDYLVAFYHITHGWINEALRGRDTRRRYQYDAFVSYSSRDELWVVEKLLPNLEQKGPPFLRLCLHSRDFQPGKDIVENITDGLYRSRRTLCLVSRHFLRSNWCSLEMRLGTYRLQAEHRDVLILVFLEKIPPNLLTAHHRLARLVKTRTYIEWPQDQAQQEAFWDRLWDKLVPGISH